MKAFDKLQKFSISSDKQFHGIKFTGSWIQSRIKVVSLLPSVDVSVPTILATCKAANWIQIRIVWIFQLHFNTGLHIFPSILFEKEKWTGTKFTSIKMVSPLHLYSNFLCQKDPDSMEGRKASTQQNHKQKNPTPVCFQN